MPSPAPITTAACWPRRAVVQETATHRRRIWLHACGVIRLVESKCLFGRRAGRRGRPAIADAYRVERLDGHCWEIVSNHHTLARAAEAAQRLADTTET